MASAGNTDFQQRLQRINQNRGHAGKTHVPMKMIDGLLVPVPSRRKRLRRGFALRGLLRTVAGLFLFKAVLLAYLGPVAYDSRVALLADGSLPEQIGARVFAADPLSMYLADWFRRLPGLF